MRTIIPEKTAPDFVHGTFTLASTDILGYCYDGNYDEYLDWCKANNIKPGAEDSADHWEWRAKMRDWDWEDDLDNIKSCRRYKVPVAVTGSAGLWNGRHEYVPEFFAGVKEAISRIINGCEFDDVDIRYEDGSIVVNGHHYDGTNEYRIRALSKKGVAKRDTAERNWSDVSELRSHDFKRLPYLYAI